MRDNLRVAAEDADDERMARALERAHLPAAFLDRPAASCRAASASARASRARSSRSPRCCWRFLSRIPDRSETGFRGTYREVEPPERIIQTFEWEGMPGHICVETAVFEDLGDRTRVTTTSLFHTTEERDGVLASGMEGGLNETYARLDELLARMAG